jgi:protein gp37
MSSTSSIEWTDASWNPATGCNQVSPGCDRCYAKTFAERFRGVQRHPYEQGFDLRLWSERMNLPVHWKKPRRIFVNSMSDLFHKGIPDDFILRVFETMAIKASHHTYQILTKRPSRLVNTGLTQKILGWIGTWPEHIWLGVSVENNEYLWRVATLRRIPATIPILFISAEPLLGPINFDLTAISWVIAGAESGHGARPMDEAWVRSIRDLCVSQHVAFFYKQNARNGHKIPLPELDGQVWQQYPRLLEEATEVQL